MLIKKFLSISHLQNFISTFTPAASKLNSLHISYTSIYLNRSIQIHAINIYILVSCVIFKYLRPYFCILRFSLNIFEHFILLMIITVYFYGRVDFIWPYWFCWYVSIQEYFRFYFKIDPGVAIYKFLFAIWQLVYWFQCVKMYS